MTCEHGKDHVLVEQYVHRRLSDADRDEFETHFLECEACFERVQNYRVMRQELAAVPLPAVASPPPTSLGLTIRAWLAVSAASAVMLAVVAALLTRTTPSPPPGAVADSEPSRSAPPAVVAPAESRAELVAQLARFDPPAYLPPNLRGVEGDSARAFRAAMERYRSGDYAAAAQALRAIVGTQPVSVDALFYLGVSDLQEGRVDDAVSALARVLQTSDPLYEEDALYLSAKAALKRGDVPAARMALQRVVALDGDRANEARQLVAAIDRLPSPTSP